MSRGQTDGRHMTCYRRLIILPSSRQPQSHEDTHQALLVLRPEGIAAADAASKAKPTAHGCSFMVVTVSTRVESIESSCQFRHRLPYFFEKRPGIGTVNDGSVAAYRR